MRYVKIAPKVANVTCGRKTLSDKEAVYPETMWPVGHVDELLKRGFLVEAAEPDRSISNPGDAEKNVTKKKLTKEDFKNNPELRIQGFKIGDEIEIPDEAKTDSNPGDAEKKDE